MVVAVTVGLETPFLLESIWTNVSEEREWEGGKVKNGRHGGRCQLSCMHMYSVVKKQLDPAEIAINCNLPVK